MEVKWTRHRPFIRFAVDSSAGIEMRYFEKMDETSVTLKFTVVQTSHTEIYRCSNLSLYEFDKGKWTFIKQRYCDRFEDCSVDDISGRHWSAWRKETRIEHPMLSLNPLIIDRDKVQDKSGQSFVEEACDDLRYIKISVNGHKSILYYCISTESDMGFAFYQSSVYFKTYKDNKPIFKSWYDTSVEYKYLLSRGPDGVLELIDLETGEKVLKDFKFASWIY
jgi:hypothetical protein